MPAYEGVYWFADPGDLKRTGRLSRQRSAISTTTSSVRRDFPASAETPQQACLDGVRQSDLVVFLLSSAYGQLQTSGLSATHEEYIEARETKPVLVFLHDGVELEPEQKNFIQQVRDWSGGSAHWEL